MSETRKHRTSKFYVNTVKDKVFPPKSDQVTFLIIFEIHLPVSIVKIKSQKIWNRSIDTCGDGDAKTLREGGSPPPPRA